SRRWTSNVGHPEKSAPSPTLRPTPADNGFVIRAYGYSDQGRFRPTNEDCFAVQADAGLCVVADGLGGHNAGDVAARITVNTIVEAVRQSHCSPAAPPPPTE